MLDRLQYRQIKSQGELTSPFALGDSKRPLRVTFHTASLKHLDGVELAATDLLRELGNLDEINVLDTEPGTSPHIEIDDLDPKHDFVTVRAVGDRQLRMSAGIWSPKQVFGIAAELVNQYDPNHPDVQAMFRELMLAQAHRSLGGDILVTASPLLMQHRDNLWVAEVNPRTPTEAAQIVGLFLRSRDIFTY